MKHSPSIFLPGLLHLLAPADPQQSQQFDSAQVAKFLEFIEITKNPNVLYHADKITDASSAYYEFDVHRNVLISISMKDYCVSPIHIRK